MSYSAIAIANFFIKKGLEDNVPVTNMKVQKLVFFAHAIYFKEYKIPLVEEPFFAWQHGPVCANLYNELRKYNDNNITSLIYKLVDVDINQKIKIAPPMVSKQNVDDIDFLNKVWEILGRIDAWKLREISHGKDTSWYFTVTNYKDPVTGETIDVNNDKQLHDKLPRNLTILDSVIQKYGK